ncbi:MAG: DEAD/DEAH box helicase family protein [Geminicoccaceae bacterium]|nr:DEAD/DEAH box helicase family protein [Geminicoccaceae bacterium]
MSLLPDRDWQAKYTPEDGDLVRGFYVPLLERAVRYDRTTGYFTASALAAAARGVAGLVKNGGRMRLVVGCTLDAAEVAAIERGLSLRDAVAGRLTRSPLEAEAAGMDAALELLAWMVADGHLDVKVAIPCGEDRRPVAGTAIFHEKSGIVEDGKGNRLAFSGGINESLQGWTGNWDSFHVFKGWDGGAAHVAAEEASFGALWADRMRRALVLDVPAAVRDELLRHLPPDDRRPRLLRDFPEGEAPPLKEAAEAPGPFAPEAPPIDPRRLVWGYIAAAPTLPEGGERVGEATGAVTPWPHQRRAFERMYRNWPPKLLIADEVGLGKTIQAGLLLRQAWLAGRAKRVLILAPKAVLHQWQLELREKFNLNWPVYDGRKLSRYPSPGLFGDHERAVANDAWHEEPFVIASSHLMRRRDRARELLERAEPWDLVVLDEAHHARRRGGGLNPNERRPNRLLEAMQRLKARTGGLVLLTATPMQVHPVEVWDLLSLLGLPDAWSEAAFLDFFASAAEPSPGHDAFARMAGLFRAIEGAYGPVAEEEVQRLVDGRRLKAKRVLTALRDPARTPGQQLGADERRAAVRLMLGNTPVRRLVSRHTRDLLRRYHKAGRLGVRVADRDVEDSFIPLSPEESAVYAAVEGYISSTYNRAGAEERSAVGFVMTVYRKRLASSFAALAQTLRNRAEAVRRRRPDLLAVAEDDAPDDDGAGDEPLDAEDAAARERDALAHEELGDIDGLLERLKRLPTDTKAKRLLDLLEELEADGYRQCIVFTQFTDTLDFLRRLLGERYGGEVICFSGRGGEREDRDGAWRAVSREETKARFRDGRARIMLCTDAAAEGLNFQFCGALVNYDLPWNPMRVEQRIGRIDRLGQSFERVRIVNLHYADTVEADVYKALRARIGLFERFVGRLQPILSKLPAAIGAAVLAEGNKEGRRAALIGELEQDAAEAEADGFDLDLMVEQDLEEGALEEPAYGLADLEAVLRRPDLLPPGAEAGYSGGSAHALLMPGFPHKVRVTTDPAFFDAHPDSCELWSPGAPVFPEGAEPSGDTLTKEAFQSRLGLGGR